jgi:pyrroline-5-carboxylate reductase
VKTIGFIGAGNMARAMGGGLAVSRGSDFELIATDPEEAALQAFAEQTGGGTTRFAAELIERAEIIVLAVKPQVVPRVLESMSSHVKPARHLVLSIAAGMPLRTLERMLGTGVRVVRAMPNTPALVRQGITVLAAGRTATREDMVIAERIFSAVGEVAVVEDEALLDAVTAVSGSGPGFVFAFAEALLAAAAAVGLPDELALRLVRRTLVGSSLLWQSSEEPVGVLRQRVTSPGGTTQAGLEALAARSFGDSVRAAIEAAARRSRELADG